MNQAKKHCYLYTRVSTQMQVDGYSLDAQQDRLKREAAHRSMQVVATFSEVPDCFFGHFMIHYYTSTR